MAPRILELESVRGIAALLIVFAHLPGWIPEVYYFQIFRNSYLMVDLFFVLSGFVIFNAYYESITSINGLLKFQFLRFGRLYPVHLLFLLLFLIIECSKYFAYHNFNIYNENNLPFSESNLTSFIQNLFLIHSIGPYSHPISFNSPSWSISVEFYTYLLFGLICILPKKYNFFILIFIPIISLLLIIFETTFGFSNLLRCFSGFFIGCLTARLNTRIKSQILSSNHFLIILIVALFTFLFLKKQGYFDSIIYLLTAFLILSLSNIREGSIKRFLNLKPLIWLGTMSYSIYMSHQFILWIENQFFRVVLNFPTLIVGNALTPQLGIFQGILAYAVGIFFVFLISHITYKLIEEPYRKKSRIFLAKHF